MKTSLKLKLNKDRKLNCGKYPLVFQIIHQRKRRLIYTNIRLFEQSFDEQNEQVVSSGSQRFKKVELQQMNGNLQVMREEVLAIVHHLEETQNSFRVDSLIAAFGRKKDYIYITTFMEYIIEQNRVIDKFGTANNYQSTMRVLVQFLNSDKAKFTDITVLFLKKFDIFLQKRKLKQNSRAFYLNNLRTIYNKAVDEGIIDLPLGGSPFDKVTIKRSKTVKRALPAEVVRQIMELDLAANKEMQLSRDLFMFSFYSRGMPLVDILNLRKENIGNNAFHYFRRKTRTLVKVSLTPQIQAIIDRYDVGGKYIFAFLNEANDSRENYKRYRNVLVWHNNMLKKIGGMIGLNQSLTTYVARHSWATVAKTKGISVAVISEGLGHSTESITNTYLKSFEQTVIDEANLQVSML